MKLKYILLLLLAAAAAVGGTLYFRSGRTVKSGRGPFLTQKNALISAVKPVRRPERSSHLDVTDEAEKARLKAAKNHYARRFPGAKLGRSEDWDGIYRDEDGIPYPKEEQDMMTLAEEVIELDDLPSARLLAESAVDSENRELREAVVEAIGWFGEDALIELMPYLSDPDEDIADSAQSHWMAGLQEMNDDGEKAGLIEMTLMALRNQDMIEDVASELVGIDELAAIQVLVDLIEAGGPAVEVAKETYNTITGEDWSDIDAAEEWLQENYDPDEDDDDDEDDEDGKKPAVEDEETPDEAENAAEDEEMAGETADETAEDARDTAGESDDGADAGDAADESDVGDETADDEEQEDA